MLSNTYVLYYNPNTSLMEMRDKYLTSVVHSFALPNGDLIHQLVYDEDRNKLWYTTTNNKLLRIGLFENEVTKEISHSLETTIATPNYIAYGTSYGKRLDIDMSNGSLFGLSGRSYVDASVFTVTSGGSSIDSSLALQPCPGPTPTAVSNDRMAMCIDQYTGKIFVTSAHYYSGSSFFSNSDQKGRSITLVENDLSSFSDEEYSVLNSFPGSYQYDEDKVMTSSYHYMYKTDSAYEDGAFHRDSNISFNAMVGKIVCPGTTTEQVFKYYGTNSNDTNTYFIDSSDLKDSTYKPRIVTGKKTGNNFLVLQNDIIVLDHLCNISGTFALPSSYGHYVEFNTYSEEFYMWNGNSITLYDTSGNALAGTFPGDFTSAITKLRILSGEADDTPLTVSPNVIVFPDRFSSTTDTTPNLVVRVGVSPAGWTQQFRVVGDTDIDKIMNGAFDSTYMRAADSFSSGTHYDADWSWVYSTDHQEGLGNSTNGTWNSLGTGNGLQSGGSEPTNGVDCTTYGSRYMRVTIPADESLTGAASNTKWYFKVFSYSAA